MIDVKKLVTGFLVLAIAASGAALAISNLGNALSGGNISIRGGANNLAGITVTGEQSTNISTPSAAPYAGNAFLPQASGSVDPNTLSDPDPALTSSTDPNNLTHALTNAYLTDLVSANPNGPTPDANGNQSLTPPSNAAVIAQLENDTASSSIQVPDWEAEADQIPISVLSTSSPNAVSNYSSAIADILNQDLVQPNLSAMLTNNSDPSAGAYVEPKIQSALQDIAGLQTPASLVGFQKSLLTYLVYGKNVLTLTGGMSSSSDPLKTALVLQAEAQKYDSVVQNLETQLQQAAAVTGFSPFAMSGAKPVIPPTTGVVAVIDNILGVKTAYALFGLGDITFDPTIFGHLLLDYAKNIALQIAKNLIMFEMQKTVLKWVRGNGTPKFIQNWGTQLVDAYTSAAINALNSQFACVNPAYQNQLQILLKIPTPGNNAAVGVCAVQFSNLLTGTNLTNFYNNFSNGGFVSYMALFQPSGNLFGSAIDAQDAAMGAGLQNYATVQTKSVANQGWSGNETCADGSDPSGTHWFCNGSDKLYQGYDGQMYCNDSPAPPYPAVQEPNNGICANGQDPETTLPGQVTGQVFNSAVDSSGKLTAAANDLAGLLDSFTSSLLNSIATNLISVTTGAVENIGSGGGSNGGTNNTQAGQVDISCTPSFQDPNNPYSVTFIGSGGQVISGSSGSLTNTAPVYSWSIQDAFGNVVTTAGNVGQFSTTFNASGTYVAVLTDTNTGTTGQCSIAVPAPGQ